MLRAVPGARGLSWSQLSYNREHHRTLRFESFVVNNSRATLHEEVRAATVWTRELQRFTHQTHHTPFMIHIYVLQGEQILGDTGGRRPNS